MDGNRKKPDGRLQFQKERFFSRFCALQVLFQQDFQPEIEWDAQRWSYYLCMISDVLDEQEEYLPYSLEKQLTELNDVWKQQKAAEKSLRDLIKELKEYRVRIYMVHEGLSSLEQFLDDEKEMSDEEKEASEEDKILSEEEVVKLKEALHQVHMAAFKVEEKAARLLKHSCLQFAQRLVDGVHAKKEQIDEQILLAAKNWRLERMGRMDLNLMRIAAFELLNKPEPPAVPTPPATAINEAIELSKVFCQADSRRFVNGVLDKLRKNNQGEKTVDESVPSPEVAPTEKDATETQPPEEITEG